jgi:hypothetical protein
MTRSNGVPEEGVPVAGRAKVTSSAAEATPGEMVTAVVMIQATRAR